MPSPTVRERGGLGPFRPAGLTALLALSFAPMAWGEPPDEKGDAFTLRFDVPQVVLAATVSRKNGAPAPDLTREAFEVYDNGRLQTLAGFGTRDQPANVGLVLDNSRSMGPRRRLAILATTAFVVSSHPEDDFFVVHFNDDVTFGLGGETAFTSRHGEVRDAVMRLHPIGQTSLYDAVAQGLEHVKQGHWKRTALLVISDGADTASETTFDALLRQAGSTTTPIYAIGVYDESAADKDPKTLKRLAAISGGRALFPRDADEIRAACERIAGDIRQQYVLSYTPTGYGQPGAFHKIEIKLAGQETKGLRVRARSGYYEPEAEHDRAR